LGGPVRLIEAESGIKKAVAAADRRGALEEIHRLYGNAIHRYVRAIIDEDAAAHDVWQNVFLQAYRDLTGFSGRSTYKTWLYKIARHRALDELRTARRRQKRLTLIDAPPDVPDSAMSPDDHLQHQQRLRALQDCLQTLSSDAREVILLRYAEGFSYLEAADVCGERVETLRARVSRAMPVLRECVEGKGV
jgi:RNA polymerase sigma-70 factor (ECF subfamily)